MMPNRLSSEKLEEIEFFPFSRYCLKISASHFLCRHKNGTIGFVLKKLIEQL
jgi:hypothetical protein